MDRERIKREVDILLDRARERARDIQDAEDGKQDRKKREPKIITMIRDDRPKKCLFCGAQYVKKRDRSWSKFLRSKYCSHACSNKDINRVRYKHTQEVDKAFMVRIYQTMWDRGFYNLRRASQEAGVNHGAVYGMKHRLIPPPHKTWINRDTYNKLLTWLNKTDAG
ncbi:MAG: hypothetical protein ACYTEQ_30120 [Planctomycetota bacterium]